jgi:hypothetical protein
MPRPTPQLRRFGFAAIAAVTIVMPASAQLFTLDVAGTYALTWEEVDQFGQPVANPNGALDPGEGARFTMALELTPAIGAVVSYTGGGGGTGTLEGLAFGYLSLHGTGGAAGAWDLTNAVPPEWSLGLGSWAWGTVLNDGADIENVQFGQFSPPLINSTNPIPNLWRAAWVPQSYAPRQVMWDLSYGNGEGPTTSVILSTQQGLLWGVGCRTNFPQTVVIPIVPPPGTLVIGAGAAGIGLTRSRRRSRER